MTQEEIIDMARQAGDVLTDSRGRMDFCFDNYGLEAFAKLVAEKEREACAKLVDYWEAREGEHADAIRARGQA